MALYKSIYLLTYLHWSCERERERSQLPSISLPTNNSQQVFINAAVTKQYNLVLAKGGWEGNYGPGGQ